MKPMDFERFTAAQRVIAPEGLTLDAAVAEHLKDPILAHYAVAEIDGQEIAREDWPETRLRADQTVRVALRPRGKAGKKVLRTVLLIAVVVVAAWITVQLGPIVGTTFATLAAAGFTAVASLAINALIPPPGLGDNAAQEVDPTYSLTGTRNRARPNAPVPVLMGSHRFTPDLVTEQFQESVGDDIWLRFGVCWGAGRMEVEDLRIGETPISEFTGIQVQHQLLPEDPPTTLIRGDFTQDSVGATLTTDWTTRRTANDAADAQILLQFPRGLGTQDDDGDPKSVSVAIEVRIRVVEDDGTEGAWSTLGTDSPVIADAIGVDLGRTGRGDIFTAGLGYDDYLGGLSGYGNPSLGRTFRRSDIKPFSAAISVALPPGKQFDISVRRTTAPSEAVDVADDVSWTNLTTWQIGPIVNESVLATSFFRIKASDQLAGFIEELNGLAHALTPTYTGPADPALASPADWAGPPVRTQNPADWLRHAVQGPHTSVPSGDGDIDWTDLARFWLWCDENDFTFSLPVDGGMARGEVLDLIARAGRARVFRHEGRLRLAIDRPRPEGPSQLLTPRNARNFSFTRNFAPKIHGLRLPFTNAEDDFRDDEIILYADGFGPNTATLIEDGSAPGMVYPDQVHGYGRYLLAQMAARTLTARCEMDVEFGTLKLGDYVRLGHPVLDETSLSTRVINGGAEDPAQGPVLWLDDAMTFDPAESYVLRHRSIVSEGDEAWLNCAGVYPLINPALGEAAPVTTDTVELADPLPAGVAILDDDLVQLGRAGEDSFEGLIRDIEPTGPAQANVELVAYLPDTLITPPAPPRTPLSPPPFPVVPTPSLVGSSITPGQINIAFELPTETPIALKAIETRWRQVSTATDGPQSAWTDLPPAPAAQREISIGIDAQGTFEVEIRARNAADRLSAALFVSVSGDGRVITEDLRDGVGRAVTGLDPNGYLTRPQIRLPDGSVRGVNYGLAVLSVQDGDAVTFDLPFATPPSVIPMGGGILTDPSLSSPVQDIAADDLTPNGFTVKARLRGPSSGGTPHTDTLSVPGGAGPQWRGDKTGGDAFDDRYIFSVSMTIDLTAGEPLGGQRVASAQVDLFTNDGTGWIARGRMTLSASGTGNTANVTGSQAITLSALGQHGGEEFAVAPAPNSTAGTITAASVHYSEETGITSVSATPGAERVQLQLVGNTDGLN